MSDNYADFAMLAGNEYDSRVLRPFSCKINVVAVHRAKYTSKFSSNMQLARVIFALRFKRLEP